MKVVGVFSREDPSCYQWLVNNLLERKKGMDVRPVVITNNFQKFRDETSKCSFAILYHSKKRGRVNVTNVTDSLYDDELKYLHDKYGKKNVLVVIDDLDSSSEEEKRRILTHQSGIAELARGLFIFSSADKATIGYQSLPPHVRGALDDIKKMIGETRHSGKKSSLQSGMHGEDERECLRSEDVPCAEESVIHVSGRGAGASPPGCGSLQLSRRCLLLSIIAIGSFVIILVLSICLSQSHVPETTPSARVTTPSARVNTPSARVTTPSALVTTPSAPVTTPSAPVTTPSAPVSTRAPKTTPVHTSVEPEPHGNISTVTTTGLTSGG